MLLNDESGDTSEELTAETAAHAFESFLSDEEDTEETESPPTQESPASESEDAEASTEQADAEDASETTEEVVEDESPEDPAATLDPNLKLKVKVNGEEVEETLAEILKGYSRTSDYTRKTQELAEQRKTHEAEFLRVQGERQMYAQRMAQLESAIIDITPQEPDWDKVQTETPDRFPQLWAQWSQHQQRIKAIREERAAADAAVQRDQEQSRAQYLQAEQEKLIEALPALKDPEVAKSTKAQMVAYVKNMGYSNEQIERLTDHRLIVLIDKAMKYDAAQQKKPAIQARIEKVKAATPGPSTKPAPSKSDAQKARERLAKTGRREDAAAAFEAFLDD